MGTSKTKVGRTDSNNPPSGTGTFKAAKTMASKYFSGNIASFATAMKAAVSAAGVDYFISNNFKKKSLAFAQLVYFIIEATSTGIKLQATKTGVNYTDDSKPKDVLYQYVNTIYPEAISDGDIFAREQLLHVADSFVSLFDEDGFFNATESISEQLIINMIVNNLVDEILGDYLSISPRSIENDKPDVVQGKMASAKEEIRNKLNTYKNAFMLDINDQDSIINYRENLKRSVVAEYYMEEETNE